MNEPCDVSPFVMKVVSMEHQLELSGQVCAHLVALTAGLRLSCSLTGI